MDISIQMEQVLRRRETKLLLRPRRHPETHQADPRVCQKRGDFLCLQLRTILSNDFLVTDP
jgi:hypothetical protein